MTLLGFRLLENAQLGLEASQQVLGDLVECGYLLRTYQVLKLFIGEGLKPILDALFYLNLVVFLYGFLLWRKGTLHLLGGCDTYVERQFAIVETDDLVSSLFFHAKSP